MYYINDSEDISSKKLLMHDEAKPFSCNKCGMKFYLEDNLDLHVKAHNERKKHIGAKTFSYDFEETSCHNREFIKLNKAKRYSCSRCEMRFYVRRNRNLHEKAHTTLRKRCRLKPFACSECGKRFDWKSCLTSHMQIHTFNESTGRNAQKSHLDLDMNTPSHSFLKSSNESKGRNAQKSNLDLDMNTPSCSFLKSSVETGSKISEPNEIDIKYEDIESCSSEAKKHMETHARENTFSFNESVKSLAEKTPLGLDLKAPSTCFIKSSVKIEIPEVREVDIKFEEVQSNSSETDMVANESLIFNENLFSDWVEHFKYEQYE